MRNKTAGKKLNRSQEERRAESRAKLIESAIRLIRERGLAETNMAEIAADVDLTRGAIQHHFRNRAELILAVISELDARLSRALEGYSLDPHMTGVERLANVIDKVIELTCSADNIAAYDLWSASRSDATIGAKAVELQKQLTEQFRCFWHRSLENHIPDDLIDTAFAITLAMTQGGAMAQLLNQPPDIVQKMLHETKTMLVKFVDEKLRLNRRPKARKVRLISS